VTLLTRMQLCDDLQAMILSKCNMAVAYFRVDSATHARRDALARAVYYLNTGNKVPHSRQAFIFVLMQRDHFVVNDDFRGRKRAILEYMRNAEKQGRFIAECLDSHERKDIHELCENLGLLHESQEIEVGRKLLCTWCDATDDIHTIYHYKQGQTYGVCTPCLRAGKHLKEGRSHKKDWPKYESVKRRDVVITKKPLLLVEEK